MIRRNIVVLFALLFFLSFGIKGQNIYTIIGITASNWAPIGVALDASGNVYFSDVNNGCVRKLNASGTNLTTFAGSASSSGYSGDGGLATSALLNAPQGIAIDALGNVYIADSGNDVIRKVDVSGMITTITGAGTSTIDGILASSAKIYNPVTISLDVLGNIYFNDGCRVRKIDTSGMISTVAGNGTVGYSGDGGLATSAQLYATEAIALDGSGNLFIADGNKDCIRKVNSAGIISTFAGIGGTGGYSGDGGLATSAQIDPSGVCADNSGNVFISDNYRVIRKVDASGIISTIAGTIVVGGYSGSGIPAYGAFLNFPKQMITDASGNLYFCDRDNGRVREICFASCLAGVDEIAVKNNFKLFPNPVSNILHIESEQHFEAGTEIEITNTLGQTVLKTPFNKEINISGLSPGFYNIKVITVNNQVYHSKIVKD